MVSTPDASGMALSHERATQADMVDVDQAAALAGATPALLRKWATMARPRVIALEHPSLGLRFPRWQFETLLWPVVRDLSRAMGGSAWTKLAWLESPHGAFDGRTPRAALEQGESVERVLSAASFSD